LKEIEIVIPSKEDFFILSHLTNKPVFLNKQK
jgi:hypothetical protein